MSNAVPGIGQDLGVDNVFDYRTINGQFNDLKNLEEGQAGNEFLRMNNVSYYDCLLYTSPSPRD